MYFNAFSSRFWTTCTRRFRSPWTVGKGSPITTRAARSATEPGDPLAEGPAYDAVGRNITSRAAGLPDPGELEEVVERPRSFFVAASIAGQVRPPRAASPAVADPAPALPAKPLLIVTAGS